MTLKLQEGASHIFPDKFQPYKDHIPVEEQGDLIAAYYRRLTSEDGEVRRAAAKQWCLWEMGELRKSAASLLTVDPTCRHEQAHSGHQVHR